MRMLGMKAIEAAEELTAALITLSIRRCYLSMDQSKNLTYLIQNMSPEKAEGNYVFTKVNALPPNDVLGEIFAFVRESEGITLILPRQTADSMNLSYDGEYALISLKVVSSLAAVGLTAHFSKFLTQANIPSNVIAGYYHDHIFVPSTHADDALKVLKKAQSMMPNT